MITPLHGWLWGEPVLRHWPLYRAECGRYTAWFRAPNPSRARLIAQIELGQLAAGRRLDVSLEAAHVEIYG